MSLSVETLAVARKYTDDSLAGAGAVAGVPCKIQSITAITGGNRVTFLWTDNNGDDHTSAMDVMNGADGEDGKGIQSVTVNAQDHLIITYTDGTTVDAGEIEIHNAVDSVNGQTGAVVLDAEDVGALPDNTPIPSKTSDLTNDSGFATTSDVSTALADYTKTADLTTLLAAKQDTLTFDNVPTENSNNPVKSGGVYNAEADIFAVMGQNGAKNLIPYDIDAMKAVNVGGTWSGNEYTYNGITFAVNSDGTITVSGIASALTRLAVTIAQFENGKAYTMTGCPEGGNHVDAYTLYTQTVQNYDDGEGVTFNWSSSITSIAIAIFSGVDLTTPITFKPMLRLASDTDSTYQSYAKTNKQLTDDAEALTNQANDMVNVLGAKNLLPFNFSHIRKINGGGTWNNNVYTYKDITYTVNADGTITVNGTATDYSLFRIIDANSIFLNPSNNYYITGSPSSSTASTYYVYYSELINGSWVYYSNLGNEDTLFTPNASATQVVVDIVVRNGATVNNLVFKPMLRLASDPDNTYVPYAMTNQQMTPYVQAISNPNLLDNPWFTVNQRCKSSYSTNGAYTVDRWINWSTEGETVAVNSDHSITLNKSASDKTVNIVQVIEEDVGELLVGKTVTLSALLSDGTIKSVSGVVVKDNTFIIGVYLDDTTKFKLDFYRYSNKWNARVISWAGGTSAAGSITIKAVKLELGSVSTLAMDTAPSYATELLKCQRYFLRISVKDASNWMLFCMVWANSAMNYILSTPVEMRSIPTVSVSNIANFIICKGASTNSRKTGTGINCFEKISTSLVGTIDVSETDLAIGDMYVIKAGSANDFIEFSADL